MLQNNKTFLPTPSAHLSKIVLFLNAGFLAYVLSACGANVPIEEVLVKDPKETKAQEVAREESAIQQENAIIDVHTTPLINRFTNYSAYGSLNGFYNSVDNLNSPMQNGMYGGYYMPYYYMPYGFMPYGSGLMPYGPYGYGAPLETETKKDKKSNKKLYDFTKNSGLEGINLEKSPTLKSHKKSDKKFYKQLAKNNIAEGVSMPVVNFNKALSFGPYFERTKSKKTQYMDGGLMMHIRF
ncbi:hypothetical protein HpBT171_14810 [Helicobacter pylori]